MICRFRHRQSGLLLDAMPAVASILGFDGRWEEKAFPNAVDFALPTGRTIRVIAPAYLLATKLEAFRSRGECDLYGSADFEDVIALIDGREELVGEVIGATAELHGFVGEQLAELSGHEDFESAAEGRSGAGPRPGSGSSWW